VTSGIRLGSPALTTRGMGKAEMRRIATLIDRVLVGKDDATIDKVRAEVETLARAYPLYQADPA
jgi:glycine hydroxymethyltransferase